MAAGQSNNSPDQQQSAIAAYTAEIEYWDRSFGRLLELLRRDGWLDHSVVVFWSDHGEEFWEHGGWEHGHSLFDEVIRVPLLIHMPGQDHSEHITDYVSLIDIMPTLLDLCGLQGPADIRGRSLMPLLMAEPGTLAESPVYLEGCCYGPIRKGLICGNLKLIYDVYRDSFSLYDLERDPGEHHNIYGTNAAPDTSQMEADLREFTQRSLALMRERVAAGGAEEIPAEIRQQLRDMGYLQ